MLFRGKRKGRKKVTGLTKTMITMKRRRRRRRTMMRNRYVSSHFQRSMVLMRILLSQSGGGLTALLLGDVCWPFKTCLRSPYNDLTGRRGG
jgi:hypothetical protein